MMGWGRRGKRAGRASRVIKVLDYWLSELGGNTPS